MAKSTKKTHKSRSSRATDRQTAGRARERSKLPDSAKAPIREKAVKTPARAKAIAKAPTRSKALSSKDAVKREARRVSAADFAAASFTKQEEERSAAHELKSTAALFDQEHKPEASDEDGSTQVAAPEEHQDGPIGITQDVSSDPSSEQPDVEEGELEDKAPQAEQDNSSLAVRNLSSSSPGVSLSHPHMGEAQLEGTSQKQEANSVAQNLSSSFESEHADAPSASSADEDSPLQHAEPRSSISSDAAKASDLLQSLFLSQTTMARLIVLSQLTMVAWQQHISTDLISRVLEGTKHLLVPRDASD